MKLVAAKCPNCGAKIDVDSEKVSTKCEYCSSIIMVEDAITKLEVEVKNLPNIENLLKNANRDYKNGEFSEAYELYCRVLELDPDNLESILRRGFCKFLETGYFDANIKIVLNSINDVFELLSENDDRLFGFIEETFEIVFKYEMLIINELDKNLFSLNDLRFQLDKLISCIDVFEFLYNISNDNKQEIKIINKIIDVCESINTSRKYESEEDSILIFDYTFPYVKDIENKYYEILLGMDPETIKNAIDGKTKLEIKDN